MAWTDGTCQYKPPPPAECDEATIELLRDLLATQETCRAKVKADVTSCAPGDIREFMLKHRQFNRILNSFSATTWVLFDNGTPPLRGQWPQTKAIADHYAAGLKYDERLLEEASHILVLSHVPNDNDSKNEMRLQKRLEVGFKFIEEVAGDDITKRNRWKRKFLAFPLPPDEAVTLDDFRKTDYANIVTWDDESQIRYGTMLESLRTGKRLTVSEGEELGKALSRSVTIVPIPCDALPLVEK